MEPALDTAYSRSRNPRACESCRISKSRCLSSEQPNICQRCLKSRLSCIVRSVARPRRARKLNVHLGERNVPENGSSQNKEDSEGVYIKLNTLPLLDTADSVAILHRHHQEYFDQLLPPDDESTLPPTPVTVGSTPQPGRTNQAGLEQVTSQRNITMDQAEKLLLSFREIEHFFPFVVIPKDATVKCLSRKHPFLLLAILSAASSADIQLRYQLDHEFKRVLSEKIILEGRKSLDFLQGILVFIAWYPCHLKPRNQQGFMYANLAVSLAHDLGLGQRGQNSSNMCPEDLDSEGLLSTTGFSKAAQRAYLGCYYLSSAISMAFQKPNSFIYNDLIEDYGISLATDAEIWSDLSLLPLVRSHRIQENIRASLYSQQPTASQYDTSPFQTDAHVQTFYNEVEEWKRSIPHEIKSSPLMVLAERFLTINVFSHDLAFFRPVPMQQDHQLNPVTLSECLKASKKFFETVLSLPALHYRAFTQIKWCQIVQSIIILSRLSFTIPRCPGWDVAAAREHAPLGMFLDCLCYRMQGLSSTSPGDVMPRDPDGSFIFMMILERIKKTYEQRVALATPKLPISEHCGSPYAGFQTPSASPIDKLHCPMRDKDLLTYFQPFQTPATNIPTNIPLYHDLWATMTVSWAGD